MNTGLRDVLATNLARIEDVLADNPSLRPFAAEALAGAYRLAILDRAVRRLELLHLPQSRPWTIEDVLRDDFWR